MAKPNGFLPKRADYAIRAMAQTRAMSRAIRLVAARPQGGSDSPKSRPAHMIAAERVQEARRLLAENAAGLSRDDRSNLIEALRDRLNGPPRLVEIKPTWRDDLADLIDEIRAAPLSHAIVGVAGFIAGTAGILGLAELIVRVL